MSYPFLLLFSSPPLLILLSLSSSSSMSSGFVVNLLFVDSRVCVLQLKISACCLVVSSDVFLRYLGNDPHAWCRSSAVSGTTPLGRGRVCHRWCRRCHTPGCHCGRYTQCYTCSCVHTNTHTHTHTVNTLESCNVCSPGLFLSLWFLENFLTFILKFRFLTLYIVFVLYLYKYSVCVCACVCTYSISSESSSHSAPNLQFPHFEAFLPRPDPSSSADTRHHYNMASTVLLLLL